MTILIATLGATWQVIPEVAGLVFPESCPIYRDHPESNKLLTLLPLPVASDSEQKNLWIITSSSKKTLEGIAKITAWNSCLPMPLALRFFIAENTDEVTTVAELQSLRELVLRVCLLASEQSAFLYYSLAGGRKTMSADLQYAASVFGAMALLHIVAPESPMADKFKNDSPEFWSQPVDKEVICHLLPANIGNYQPRDILAIDGKPLTSSQFSLLKKTNNTWTFSGEDTLNQELLRREKDAGQLLINYLNNVAEKEKHENWRHLYRLPPQSIAYLKAEKVSKQTFGLIAALPKAELHCHLGGILTLNDQVVVGQSIWQSMSVEEQEQAFKAIKPLLDLDNWPWSWVDELFYKKSPLEKSHLAAGLLSQCKRETLNHNLYQVTEPRIALMCSEHQFAAYERPGVLTGSAVLGNLAALPAYVAAIHRYVKDNNIQYLELRGSPHKYNPQDPQAWLEVFHQTLMEESDSKCIFRFIWIIDRRQADTEMVVRYAVAAKQHKTLKDVIVGIDLAGDETKTLPEQLAPHFSEAFAACLQVTIHAGEGTSAENIWSAAYHLHADRIGHGLSLADNTELLKKFRNRNICLELCPTSNVEVIGFESANNTFSKYPAYPIDILWQQGVSLTINTDNPGISRTTLNDEYIKAAELWPSMSLWDCLAINKQAFSHAMCDSDKKEKMMKEMDLKIFKIVSEYCKSHEAKHHV